LAEQCIVARHLLADDVKEVVGTAVTDEAKLPLEVCDRLLEAIVGAQVSPETLVLRIELDHCLGVVDGALYLGSAADHARISEKALYLLGAEVGDRLRIEAREGIADPLPLGVDHPPAHAGLEDGSA
jgi:hypothetical protein